MKVGEIWVGANEFNRGDRIKIIDITWKEIQGDDMVAYHYIPGDTPVLGDWRKIFIKNFIRGVE